MEDEIIIGPDGGPLIEAEYDLLLSRYSEWQDETGEDMPLADYAATFFFENCMPATPTAAPAPSMYPDLAAQKLQDQTQQSSDSPSAVMMSESVAVDIAATADAHLPTPQTDLPILDRSSPCLPVLERTSAALPTVEHSINTALPILELGAGLPILERSGFHTAQGTPVVTTDANEGVALPALHRIHDNMPKLVPMSASASAAKPEPADTSELRRVQMPTLERIDTSATVDPTPCINAAPLPSSRDMVPTATIQSALSATRGLGMDVMFKNNSITDAYEHMFDEDEDATCGEGAAATDTNALVHSFGTLVRGGFAANPQTLASTAAASRATLLDFAVELRTAVAGIAGRNANHMLRQPVVGVQLNAHKLALLAEADAHDYGRAAFLTAATALADSIQEDPEGVRMFVTTVGIKLPDVFVSTLSEAWKRMLYQAMKDMHGVQKVEVAYEAMAAVFRPIRMGIVLNERKKPALTRRRLLSYGYIGGTIVKASVRSEMDFKGTKAWTDDLFAHMYHDFDSRVREAYEAQDVPPEPATVEPRNQGDRLILAQPTIAKKVLRGLQILAHDAQRAVNEDALRDIAVTGTYDFLNAFFTKKSKKTTFISRHVSAVAGLELMQHVASVSGYADVYDLVIVQPLVEIMNKTQGIQLVPDSLEDVVEQEP